MKISVMPTAVALVLFFARASLVLAVPPDQVMMPRAAAKVYFDFNRVPNPKAGDGFRQLVRMFGDKNEYTAAEVQAARDGIDVFKDGRIEPGKDQNGEPPPGALSRATVQSRYTAVEALDPSKAGAFARLVKRVGNWDWYTFDQVANAETVADFKEPEGAEKQKIEAVREAYVRGEERQVKLDQGWHGPRIRHDWRDVLYDEDPSQFTDKPKALGDLQGATFSYTRDQVASTDTWSAHAALIVPFTHHWPEDQHFGLDQFAIAPSVTYDRVDTNGDPKKEVDSILYRLGFYLDFFGLQSRSALPTDVPYPGGGPNPAAAFGGGYGLQLRAAGVYATNQDHDAGLAGFELDLEPRWLGQKISLGYRTVLWRKVPSLPDATDDALFEAQLRLWLHAEGGDVLDAGAGWVASNDNFFRVGPSIQLQLRAPALPGGRALSLTVLYSYLGAITGPDDHPFHLQTALVYDLFRDKELNHKVSINATYERGGLDLTKQNVDSFTLGLGVLF